MDKKENASGVPRSVDASGEPVTLGESNGFEIYPMPMFARLLRRGKYQDVLLVPAGAGAATQPPTSMTLTFQVEDLDALAAQARAAASLGVSAIEGPVETPWNTRDLRVTDPACHRLVFTSRQANPDPEQVERLRNLLRPVPEAER